MCKDRGRDLGCFVVAGMQRPLDLTTSESRPKFPGDSQTKVEYMIAGCDVQEGKPPRWTPVSRLCVPKYVPSVVPAGLWRPVKNKKAPQCGALSIKLAEKERFELSMGVNPYTLSRGAPSATRPFLRRINFGGGGRIRTHGTCAQRFSRPPPSTTRPLLHSNLLGLISIP